MTLVYIERFDKYRIEENQFVRFDLHCNECVWIVPGTEKDDSDE